MTKFIATSSKGSLSLARASSSSSGVTTSRRRKRPEPAKWNGQFLLAAAVGLASVTVLGQQQEGYSYECDFYGDTCRLDWQLDGFCNNADQNTPSCLGADCWDCDPCQTHSYSCSACVEQPGCTWCPGDALCLTGSLDADFWSLHPLKVSSCPTAEDWKTSCTAPIYQDNVYQDALYDAMKWMYQLIQVESVWKQGITGNGVKVRINDNGVDAYHPEFIGAKFDFAFSCEDQHLPVDQEKDIRGTAMASLVGADDNGACAVGIAPGVTISSCNINKPADAGFVWNTQLKEGGKGVDISVNANWGPPTCTKRDDMVNQRRRRLQQPQTCIFNPNHEYSPCQHCPTDLSELDTTGDTDANSDFPLCRDAITMYCRGFYDLDPIPCANYLNWFVQCSYNNLDATTQNVLVENIVKGRRELGVVFVVPSGDNYRFGGDANFNGFANSRFTIVVGGVGKDGKHASYSTPGAPLWISAPAGDLEYLSNNLVARPGGGCTDAGPGTSFAAAVVGGVVALMLEVAPNLTWRDVMVILAQTAQSNTATSTATTTTSSSKTQDNTDNDWTTNAAGYKHSYKYGFGIVNAQAAVNISKSWINLGREEQIMVESAKSDKNLIIWDDPNNATVSTIEVANINSYFRIESVVVYLELDHASRGDLKITLTSPGGTESILAPSKRPETTRLEPGGMWQLLTTRNFWEHPGGDWVLRIVDEQKGPDVGDCFDQDFEYIYTLAENATSEIIRCSDLDVTTTCTNTSEVAPALLEAVYEGRTIFESCCKCGGGVIVQNTTHYLKAWSIAIFGHVESDSNSTELFDVTESTCKFTNDTCTLSRQFDHKCDDNLIHPECIGMDCFDCDSCQAFNYDCHACTTAGCRYCVGDGTCISVALDESFWALYPEKIPSCPTAKDWVVTCDAVRKENVFRDPLYGTMLWSYTMINVEEAWNRSASGKGVHVRINDDGVDADHVEFQKNFDRENSCEFFLPRDKEKDMHGTAVASIVAGNANDQCAVGIAPEATISSCVGPDELDDAPDLLVQNLDTVDISTNSWGPNVCQLKSKGRGRRLQQCIFSLDHPDSPCEACGDFNALDELSDECEAAVSTYCKENYETDTVACSEFLDLFVACEYHMLPLDAYEAFVNATTKGRNGNGIIFVFSAGNTNKIGGDVNFNGFLNSRYTIAVGAVGKDEKHASYSTTGAAVFVSAPGADRESISGNIVAKPDGGCHDIGYGTSFAAPVVSGVLALMLQVNPRLGWRDVQGLLALTSRRIDPDNPSWVTNAAGYNHSYQYGFGMVSTVDALNKASVWENFRAEKQLMNESGIIDLPIMDSPSTSFTISTLAFSEQVSANFVIESVVVYLDVRHPSRGDLKCTLVSPGGTESILQPGKRPEDTQLRGEDIGKWKLLSLRSWGEFPTGEWSLGLKDEKPGSLKACHDLPWEFVYQKANGNNETITCKDFEDVTRCNDEQQVSPELTKISYEGRTLIESCCRCGGGEKSTDIMPTLRSWKLVLYGHIIESPEELLVFPPLKPSEADSRPGVAGNDNGDGDGDGNQNSTSKPAETTGWDDRGNSGEFSGGGGTAYYGGWQPGDPVGSRNNHNDKRSDGRWDRPVLKGFWVWCLWFLVPLD